MKGTKPLTAHLKSQTGCNKGIKALLACFERLWRALHALASLLTKIGVRQAPTPVPKDRGWCVNEADERKLLVSGLFWPWKGNKPEYSELHSRRDDNEEVLLSDCGMSRIGVNHVAGYSSIFRV